MRPTAPLVTEGGLMTASEVALMAFALCNSMRVLAYIPQIVKIGRDQQGATAISYMTWSLFGISHLSTAAYAILVVDDWRMAAVFVANTLCCVIILGLTAWKRALFKATQNVLAAAGAPLSDQTRTVRNGHPAAFRVITGRSEPA